MDEFHEHGKIVKGLNPIFIVIIPKVSNVNCLDQFRPISLQDHSESSVQ